MADSRGWSSGWQDWSGWQGWQHGGQDWSDWQGWQHGWFSSVPAASAGSTVGSAVCRLMLAAADDTTTRLRQDQERTKLGLTGAWVDWDIHAFRRLVVALPDAGFDAKESIGSEHPPVNQTGTPRSAKPSRTTAATRSTS